MQRCLGKGRQGAEWFSWFLVSFCLQTQMNENHSLFHSVPEWQNSHGTPCHRSRLNCHNSQVTSTESHANTSRQQGTQCSNPNLEQDCIMKEERTEFVILWDQIATPETILIPHWWVNQFSRSLWVLICAALKQSSYCKAQGSLEPVVPLLQCPEH